MEEREKKESITEKRGQEAEETRDIIEEIEVEDLAVDGICGVY